MKRSIAVGVAFAGVLSAGCASIVKGSSQTISVNSNVEGADVFLDGVKIGTTPFTGNVPKNKAVLMVQKRGYTSTNVAVSKSIEPIFWGNIITGGTLGSLTDFASGAAYQYAPATYQVDLRLDGQAQAEFSRRAAARQFAMLNADKISADFANGSGDHLRTLLGIVNGGPTGPVNADAVRMALVAGNGDPVQFGNRIVELIPAAPPSAPAPTAATAPAPDTAPASPVPASLVPAAKPDTGPVIRGGQWSPGEEGPYRPPGT